MLANKFKKRRIYEIVSSDEETVPDCPKQCPKDARLWTDKYAPLSIVHFGFAQSLE